MNGVIHIPESPVAPRDLRASGGGGRLLPVNPEAVETFKRVMAAKAADETSRRPAPAQASPSALALAKKLQERAAAKRVVENGSAPEQELDKCTEDDVSREDVDKSKGGRKPLLDDEGVHEAHLRYCLGVEAEEASVLGSSALLKRFRRMGLPTRLGSTQGWRPEDAAEAARIHGLELAQLGKIAGQEAPKPAKKAAPRKPAPAKPNAKPKPQAAALAVVEVEPETAVVPNGQANGHQPGDLRGQLAVIQELMSLAEAQQVTLRGKISVELHAEITF